MTTDVTNALGDKWIPLPVEVFFTPQRAPDMWFADELPPTIQRELASPLVTQSRAMLGFSIVRQLMIGERQRAVTQQQQRYNSARNHMGKRGRRRR